MTELSPFERQLANEMSVLLSQKIWNDLSFELIDGDIWNIGQSNYEQATHALNLVAVYRQTVHYTRHKPLVPVEKVAAHMSSLESVSREAFDELLSAFIVNFIVYESDLKGDRNPFRVSERVSKAAELLIDLSYAKGTPAEFSWTKKIAPLMERWHIWDEDSI